MSKAIYPFCTEAFSKLNITNCFHVWGRRFFLNIRRRENSIQWVRLVWDLLGFRVW